MKIQISNTIPGDEVKLCEVAVSAFLEADRYLPSGAATGGPPGHDSVEKHLFWINECIYIKYEEGGAIFGGCIAELNDTAGFILGIFVAENKMNQGVGSDLLKHLITEYPSVSYWELETPDYLQRNHVFYEKHGFELKSTTGFLPELGYGFRTYRRSA
jgi:GNAT superfamily N-acetyltransferase